MAEAILVRRVYPNEVCGDLDCKHQHCRRFRDMLGSPCLFCGRHMHPSGWCVDMRTTRQVHDDIWYAGFAHLACASRYLRRSTPRMQLRYRHYNPLISAQSLANIAHNIWIDDPQYPQYLETVEDIPDNAPPLPRDPFHY